jgi:hypothetical protein
VQHTSPAASHFNPAAASRPPFAPFLQSKHNQATMSGKGKRRQRFGAAYADRRFVSAKTLSQGPC